MVSNKIQKTSEVVIEAITIDVEQFVGPQSQLAKCETNVNTIDVEQFVGPQRQLAKRENTIDVEQFVGPQSQLDVKQM